MAKAWPRGRVGIGTNRAELKFQVSPLAVVVSSHKSCACRGTSAPQQAL